MSNVILIAASGTGGHLMPATYIAEALQEYDVQFIGSGRPLEAKIIDQRGYVRHVIPIVGVHNRGVKGLVQFLWKLPVAFVKTWSLFSKLNPTIVIGVGGYVSFLPVFIAWLRRVPSVIHECEISPGLANSVLASFATKITTAFDGVAFQQKNKVVVTGHPVKAELVRAAASSNLPDRPAKLLIMGGSQGAKGIDLALSELASEVKQLNLSVWHQCRAENKELLSKAYELAGVDAKVVSFIDKMEEAYEWADLIISRAGAGSISEIDLFGIPYVLVPLLSVPGQIENAEDAARRDVAKVCKEGDSFKERLFETISDMCSAETYSMMKTKSMSEGSFDASNKIALLVKQLATSSNIQA